LGHKTCKAEPAIVPKNMGWLWNTSVAGISHLRRGWRPGAITKTVANTMKHFLNIDQDTSLSKEPNVIEDINDKNSTLRVKKQCGDYTITLNPNINASESDLKPPVVFKIAKSNEAKKRHEAKEVLKERGIVKKCSCSSITSCKCYTLCEKEEISCELRDISKTFCLNPEMRFIDLNQTSESELDFEFTPPFAMKNKFKKHTKVSYTGTQYEKQDIPIIESESDVKACNINMIKNGSGKYPRPKGEKNANKGGKNEICLKGVKTKRNRIDAKCNEIK
jgi:Domain of unknown function (DUF4776)